MKRGQNLFMWLTVGGSLPFWLMNNRNSKTNICFSCGSSTSSGAFHLPFPFPRLVTAVFNELLSAWFYYRYSPQCPLGTNKCHASLSVQTVLVWIPNFPFSSALGPSALGSSSYFWSIKKISNSTFWNTMRNNKVLVKVKTKHPLSSFNLATSQPICIQMGILK